MYVYVCIFIYIYIYIHICIHIYIYIYTSEKYFGLTPAPRFGHSGLTRGRMPGRDAHGQGRRTPGGRPG